jgi:hypothetical protein
LEAQSSSSELRRLKGSVRLEAALHASHAADDSRASQRTWRVLGKPKDGQTLYLKPDSLSSLETILQRFAPKRKLDQTIRVRGWPEPTSFYRYRQQSKELYDSLYVQLFAVIDESGRSVIVFDGRLCFGRINPRSSRKNEAGKVECIHESERAAEFDGLFPARHGSGSEGLREQRSSKSLLIAPVHLRALL